jgi:hypothetical protein
MKKRLSGFLIITFIFILANQLKAINISGQRPVASKVNSGPGSYILESQITSLNNTLEEQWNEALTQAHQDTDKYGDQPKLAEGFSNSNTYVSQAATQRAYQGYDLFALTLGLMVGGQVSTSNVGTIEDDFNELEEEGDIEMGVAAQVPSIQLGLNIGKFPLIPKDLYLGLKFGSTSLLDSFIDTDYEFEDGDKKHKVNFDALNWGISLNYQLIKQKSLFGLVVWRGISIGSGLLYQSNKIDYELNIDPIREDFSESLNLGPVIGQEAVAGTLVLNPSVKLGIESTTYTIPLELMTSLRLLYILNLSIGGGVDLNFGSTDIILESNGDVDVEGDITNYVSLSQGNILIDGSTKDQSPSFVKPRIMANAGVGLGPLVVDLPVTYYFNNGFSLGISAGIIW